MPEARDHLSCHQLQARQPGRHGKPRDQELCREKAMKASFSQDSQRRLAADG